MIRELSRGDENEEVLEIPEVRIASGVFRQENDVLEELRILDETLLGVGGSSILEALPTRRSAWELVFGLLRVDVLNRTELLHAFRGALFFNQGISARARRRKGENK